VLRAVKLTELLCQGFVGVTDRAEKNISSLLRGFQVGKLRDGATTQNAYAETIRIFQHLFAFHLFQLEKQGSGLKQAAEKVAFASRQRPSAAKAGPAFNLIRTG
jgi:hypothetical protein